MNPKNRSMARVNACIDVDFYTDMPKLKCTRDISSGTEIFIDYGNNYKF
jgi:hypothetical protein